MNSKRTKPLLEVENLVVNYESSSGAFGGRKSIVRAVKSVSFTIEKGTTVGLVGESGSGKSTIGKAITRIAPQSGGTILYDGIEISGLTEKEFLPYRKKIQTIFQDPYASMNPRMNIASIVAEPLMIHEKSLGKGERDDRVAFLLEKVGLSPDMMKRYPHQFSGGQRQRICIARALSSQPEFIICDECVSALDVSVQAQIVNLLQDIQDEFGITYLFIAHDLAVVEHMSEQVLVLSAGELVESASAEAIYKTPQHPYTRKLLNAVPKMPTIVKSNAFE
ncbi:ATP-binding cassette domain-containing protein [Puniceicoccaceae bacterium K14]|nr:ATP-binding cassette domain-containing protein [Puniceicoccaceae bacterium K14]